MTALLALVCPRCMAPLAPGALYGPCRTCRTQLRHNADQRALTRAAVVTLTAAWTALRRAVAWMANPSGRVA